MIINFSSKMAKTTAKIDSQQNWIIQELDIKTISCHQNITVYEKHQIKIIKPISDFMGTLFSQIVFWCLSASPFNEMNFEKQLQYKEYY